MKKNIIIIFLAFVVNVSFSQKNKGFNAGVFGGLIASQVDGDWFTGYNRLGIQTGIFTNYMFSDNMGYQLEIKYIQKGSKNVNQKAGTYFELKLDYIEIPVMLNYKLDKKMYVEGGIGIAYLIRALEDRDGAGYTNYDPPFEKYDISAIGGFNYMLSDNLIGNIKYSYSILPIRPNPGNQAYWANQGSYNNLLSMALYLMF